MVHGKIDSTPTNGKTYTFQSDNETFSVTITDVQYEDGEAVCFKYTSEDDIGQVLVKGGPETETYSSDLDGWLCAPENDKNENRTYYQISHVSFCGRPDSTLETEYYQLDLVEGTPTENLDPNNLYDAQNRLVRWVTVGSNGQRTGGSDGPTSEHEGECIDDGPITFDAASNEASVEVALKGDCQIDLTLSLVGYRLPSGETTFNKATADQQVFVGGDTESFAPGESDTLSIDLDD